jgi:CHAT domain-containing protein
MHKKRRKAYRNLINALLNCNEGEEWELLQAHQDLVELHFIQEIQKVVEELTKKGDERGADFLQNLADTLINSSAYRRIIEQLLNCASDEEVRQILEANRDWVDAGLQQRMLEVAEDLRTQGYLDKSNFLMNLVEELMGVHGNTSDTQLNFLKQVLQTTAESGGDAQKVYSLLKANQNLLDDNFARTLRNWATTTLSETIPEQAQFLAKVIRVFSELIEKFPTGNQATNLEIAIAGYESAVIFMRQISPEEWADIQYNLGWLYRDRPSGERAENLETAIRCFKATLEVFNQQNFPQSWADTQTKLAVIYRHRLQGEQAENQETAIRYYLAALDVYTCQDFPQFWANTQYDLGVTYLERLRGKRTENVETAIHYLFAALEVYTSQTHPQYWADTQRQLGLAYLNRIQGERSENLEAVIRCCKAALEIYTRQDFPAWVITQYNLGVAYKERQQAEKSENLESAIHCFEAVLEEVQTRQEFTEQEFPEGWVMTQYNLGLVYLKRIKGERNENLESAIRCFEAVLEVCTRQSFPEQWANARRGLGEAYYHMQGQRGERAKNLESAIYCFEAVLQVWNHQEYPYEWAEVQNNLGLIYLDRLLGNRVENWKIAAHCFEAASQVWTRQKFPDNWARTQCNLGLAYSQRLQGEDAEDLEIAIRLFLAALEVHTRQDFPNEWANLQNNLGVAYKRRIRGDRAENLETAIRCYEAALEVHTCQDFPRDWAKLQNNLGEVYRERLWGKRPENLETAIRCYEAALEIRTRQDFPYDWAETTNNLGIVYLQRLLGERTENLETAIRHFEAILEVYTCEAFPKQWAETHINLGTAYYELSRGEETQNLETTICHYLRASEVLTREAFPQVFAKTQWGLGRVYQDSQQFLNARDAFAAAIDTVESLRDEIVFGSGREEDKQKLAEEFQWDKLYQGMVEVCLELGDYNHAIEYVERSKTRSLLELILTRSICSIFPPDVVSQLNQLRSEIISGQYRLQTATADDPASLAQHLQQLRQKRQDLQDRYLPIGYGFEFDKFQSTLDDQIAILQWYITSAGVQTFIITRNNPLIVVSPVKEDDPYALINWMVTYLEDYREQKDKWRNQLTSILRQLAEILHLNEILIKIPKECDRLILIPHFFLHLLPLHALPLAIDGGGIECETSCLLDYFPKGVSYAPSCQLLKLAQIRQQQCLKFTRLFAIQNPTGDLTYADIEVEAIKRCFESMTILKEVAATKDAINDEPLNTFHCIHFSCHGYFNLYKAQKSALILSDAYLRLAPDKFIQFDPDRYLQVLEGGQLLDIEEFVDKFREQYVLVDMPRLLMTGMSILIDLDKCLTLDTIFSLKLEQCRLVTLSACETGLIDFANVTEEYTGLPSGFLVAGSPCIVTSLWTVNDLSTSFLMTKFYENLQEQAPITLALNQAQQWLRDLKKQDLEIWIAEKRLPLNPTLKMDLNRHLHTLPDDTQPFQAPFHWAAFCAIGQ